MREYGFLAFSDMCRVWDDATETWDPSACTVRCSLAHKLTRWLTHSFSFTLIDSYSHLLSGSIIDVVIIMSQ